jgi:hypothetical protein
MRKFSNTIELVSFTVQVGLTTMFIAGALRVLYAIVVGDIVESSFGLMG